MCLPGTVEKVRHELGGEPQPEPAGMSRRMALAAGGAGAVVALLPGGAAAQLPRRRGRRRVRDLTHVFTEGFPVYSGDAPTRDTLVTVENDGFYSQSWTFGEHSGTHMDAPGHFIANGRLADELRPRDLIAHAAVIDISERAASDPDAMVLPSDIKRYERRHGRLPRGAIVFMHSGWEARLSDPASYKNAGTDGKYHFPGFGIDALDFLLEKRDITGIGVDTMSLDIGPSSTFDVHTRLLAADRYGLENVANLSRIPPRGAQVFVGVIPWEKGSGGPCRLLATY